MSRRGRLYYGDKAPWSGFQQNADYLTPHEYAWDIGTYNVNTYPSFCAIWNPTKRIFNRTGYWISRLDSPPRAQKLALYTNNFASDPTPRTRIWASDIENLPVGPALIESTINPAVIVPGGKWIYLGILHASDPGSGWAGNVYTVANFEVGIPGAFGAGAMGSTKGVGLIPSGWTGNWNGFWAAGWPEYITDPVGGVETAGMVWFLRFV